MAQYSSMKALAHAGLILAITALFGGCVTYDAPATSGGGAGTGADTVTAGGGGAGGGGAGSAATDAGKGGSAGAGVTPPITGGAQPMSAGGSGAGSGPSSDCPRARVQVADTGPLNVRPDPSTQNAPVGALPNGAIVDVVEQVTGEGIDGNVIWFSITSGALSGYISSAFASCTTELPPEPPDGYYAPLHCGTGARITQGNMGSTSHNGTISLYAFDFGVGLNTEILAMADGTVAYIHDETGPGDLCYNGGGAECVAYANYVVLRHGDNTMTAYKHLNEVLVSVGDSLARGDVVGLSGTTGWSTGPHLHVVREEDCGSASCASIPLSFVDFPSNGGVPVTGDVVTSGNCP
jgi:hypothetical protein